MRKIAATAILAAGIAYAPSAGAADFVYSSWVAANNGLNVQGVAPYLERVRNESNGALNWKLLAGAQLLNTRNTLSGIGNKVADAGQVVPVFTRKELPANNVLFDMTVFGDTAVGGGAAAIETILLHCPDCLEEYHKNNAVFLGGYTGGDYTLMCAKPVKTVEDLKGKKVRITGSLTRIFQQMGAVPVNMSAPEGVTAMQRGALDCLVGTPYWLESWGYIDSVKHVLDFSFGHAKAMAMMVINRDVWKAMPLEHKKIMLKHLPLATASVVINTYMLDDIKSLENARKKGIEITKGGQDFKDAMAAFIKSEAETIPKYFRGIGYPNADKVMEAYQRVYPKWAKLAQEIGTDVNKYAEALEREIYSKVDPDKL